MNIKDFLIKPILAGMIIAFTTNQVYGEELTGRDIAVKVDEQQSFRTMMAVSKMILVNKRNQQRIRKVHRWTQSFDQSDEFSEKALIIFESPADVRNTALLMFSYNDPSRDDDRWLYLPALKKVRRISAKQKGDYFMGTDFTYDDMGDREVDKDTYRRLEDATVAGRPCYVVEAIPVDKNDLYGKRIIFVDKERWLPLKIEFFDHKGKLLKIMTSENHAKTDGIWTSMKITMDNISKKHKTIIEIEEVHYNQEIPEVKFTQSALRKGL